MAGNSHSVSVSELRDLRAWHAFLIEAHGVCRDLESLRFLLGLPLDDALAAFGMGGSVWAHECWLEVRASLDAPVDDPLAHEDELPVAA